MLPDVIAAAQIDLDTPNDPNEPAVLDAIGAPLQILLGPEFLEQTTDYPRIVVVPTEDQYRAAGFNPIMLDDDDQGTIPQPIWSDFQFANVHFWDADYGSALGLSHRFLRALSRVNAGNYELVGSKWEDKVRDIRRGRTLVMKVGFGIPVLETVYPSNPPGETSFIRQGFLITTTGEHLGCSSM